MLYILLAYFLGLLSIPILRWGFTKIVSPDGSKGLYSDEKDSFALNVQAPQTRWFNMGYWIDEHQSFTDACEELCERTVRAAYQGLKKDALGPRIFEAGCGAGDSARVWHRLWKIRSYVGVTIEEGQYKRAVARTAELADTVVRRGDAVKEINLSEEKSIDVITAVDCAYQSVTTVPAHWICSVPQLISLFKSNVSFRSRDDFLRSSYQALSDGGYLCMTDQLLPAQPLSLKNRLLLRSLCRLASLPYSNLRTVAQHKKELEKIGYRDIDIEDISDRVWPGFLQFLNLQDQEIGFALKGWQGLMIFGKIIEWYSNKDDRKLVFCIVSARK